ncbi:MAG: hypothetical protein ACI9FJ_002530, partial [Alteromonadaceae bacterium]
QHFECWYFTVVFFIALRGSTDHQRGPFIIVAIQKYA